MALYAGLDLHSTNTYVGVLDDKDSVVVKKRCSNRMENVLGALAPFREEIAGVVVESTYNWYWLVDGLMENGYKVHLANPGAIVQYNGLKCVDDKTSALFLARLLRLGILPEGYIYPKEERPLRDLFRKRMMLVHERTAHILAAQSLIDRCFGVRIRKGACGSLFSDSYQRATFDMHQTMISHLSREIASIERTAKKAVKVRREFAGLMDLPGIGSILAMTIMLEVGDIARFSSPGQYSSYCRCVRSIRSSNGRKKGEGNAKNGNKYLSWAYVEAVHCAIRSYPSFTRWYEKKKAATNGAVATKALCNKLARASYFVMRDQARYEEGKLFRE